MRQSARYAEPDVMRAVLRLYDLVQTRIKDGETVSFSGDEKRPMEFIGPDLHTPTPVSKDEHHD